MSAAHMDGNLVWHVYSMQIVAVPSGIAWQAQCKLMY